MAVTAVPLDLDEGQEAALLENVSTQLSAALQSHEQREAFLAKLLRAYKALPEVEEKNFPWKGASNVVVPYVAICVDSVAARLQRALLGPKDPVECHLSSPKPFPMANGQPLTEKDVRDWVSHFLDASGSRDRLRTILWDVAQNGDGFVKPMWIEEGETYHGYNDEGQVVELNVPGYTGVRWHVASSFDVIGPRGFDEWGQLPWFSNRLRMTWEEIKKAEQDGIFFDVDRIKNTKSERRDKQHLVQKKAERQNEDTVEPYTLFEIHGMFEILGATPDGATERDEPSFQEVILIYEHTKKVFLRKIYNPFFGRSRHFVKIPYLVQPHQMYSLGVAEMSYPFQIEASTAHNQVIDAATAANAGIVIRSPGAGWSKNQEIYPGCSITAEKPKEDIQILHLSEPSPHLVDVEERAAFLMEKRTGVSVYNLGMESATVGSRATATGTTALISEGNIRFWVSIDDMRRAIEELLYLTIQQEQQFRPGGYEWAPGRYIQFPPGDPRLTLGLKLSLSSESINRDLEVQQMQLLIQVLNDYYMRINQAGAILFNPQFPEPQKMLIFQTMNAAAVVMKRFVERFDIENLDMIVPTVLSALQGFGAAMGAAGAPGGMAGPMGLPPAGGTGGASSIPGGGTPAQPGAVGQRGESGSDTTTTGRNPLPVT